MEDREFHNCCGIMTISDFGHTDVTGGQYGATASNRLYHKKPPTKEEIRAYLERVKESYKTYGMILVALNSEQKVALESIFTEAGFKLVSEGLNSHHNSTIYLYSYTFHEYFNEWDDDDYEWDEEPDDEHEL